jgi:hypothetical protein
METITKKVLLMLDAGVLRSHIEVPGSRKIDKDHESGLTLTRRMKSFLQSDREHWKKDLRKI